jgi:hypothetical protein
LKYKNGNDQFKKILNQATGRFCLSATNDEFHPQAATSPRQIIQFTPQSPQMLEVMTSNNNEALSSSAILQTLARF